MAPEDQLEQHGLDPGLVHGLNLIRSGPTVGQKWLEGGRNRDEQGEDVSQGDMVGSLDGVGAVLAPAGVA